MGEKQNLPDHTNFIFLKHTLLCLTIIIHYFLGGFFLHFWSHLPNLTTQGIAHSSYLFLYPRVQHSVWPKGREEKKGGEAKKEGKEGKKEGKKAMACLKAQVLETVGPGWSRNSNTYHLRSV